MRLLDIPSQRLGAIEKVVASYFLSLMTFFLASVPLNPLTPSISALSVDNLIATSLMAIAMGFVAALAYYIWQHIEVGFLGIAGRIRLRLGVETVPGSAVNRAVVRLWEDREVNDVVIADKNGQTYRGFIGLYSLQPELQIVLIHHKGRNPERLEIGGWKSLEEWALVFSEENIRWIGATKCEENG